MCTTDSSIEESSPAAAAVTEPRLEQTAAKNSQLINKHTEARTGNRPLQIIFHLNISRI